MAFISRFLEDMNLLSRGKEANMNQETNKEIKLQELEHQIVLMD